MTKNQLQTFMQRVGIPENKWIRLSNLEAIHLDSGGNHFLTTSNEYYFDTVNDLIKIREYYYLKDIGKTYVLHRFSNLDADIYFDLKNIMGFSIGQTMVEKPNPLLSYLYSSKEGI